MAFDPFQVPRHAIEAPCQSGLKALGAVGRQVGGERRFDDKRLRHALARSIVRELPSEIRREAKGVLGPHGYICMSSSGSSETCRATVPRVRCMMRWR